VRTEQEVKEMRKSVSDAMKKFEDENEGEDFEELAPVLDTLSWVLGDSAGSTVELYFPA
jgi:hypothetical protein